MNSITITREQLKRFAPKAKPQYVDALMSNLSYLEEAGILESELRVCHFFGQVGAETDYLTLFRESMHYTTTKALRNAWPSRFGPKSDADLKHLLKNPVGLGEVVYGLQSGRKPEDLGNTQPGDGYAFRGGGWFQSTGRGNVARYAAKCGVECTQELLDDPVITLRFACLEWQESNCNKWADENDLTKVSKAINTGSATSKVKPVGMEKRQKAFAKAWEIWGESGKADKPVVPDDVKAAARDILVKAGGGAAVLGTGGTVAVKSTSDAPTPAPPAPKPVIAPKETVAKAKDTAKEVRETVEVAKDYYSWAKPTAVAAYQNAHIVGPLVAVIGLVIFWPRIKDRLPWG